MRHRYQHPVIKPFPQFPCPLDFGNDAQVIVILKVWKELFLIMIEDVQKDHFERMTIVANPELFHAPGQASLNKKLMGRGRL